jgi:hypothetical protein
MTVRSRYVAEERIIQLAEKAAGNWKKFECFSWHEPVEEAEYWTIVDIETRDSNLMTQSNADAIRSEMERFVEEGAAEFQRFNHFAFGWVESVVIRVYDEEGRITEAFKLLCRINEALLDYPALDDEDYSRRRHKATLQNIRSESYGLDYDSLPDDWPEKVFDWVRHNDRSSIQDSDGDGYWIDRKTIEDALSSMNATAQSDERSELG